VAASGYSVNSNQPVRTPYWENDNWGWSAVAFIFMFLLAAIVIYSPPDLADRSVAASLLADRSTSASLSDDETTGRAPAPQR
jgi:hypothetical protein